MRILIASTASLPALNGQAIFTQNLIDGLAKRGHAVLAVFPSQKGAAYEQMQTNPKVAALKSYNSLAFLHSDVYFSLFSAPAFQKIFDTFRPEIVHIQDHYPVSQDAVRVARRNGAKLIGTNHFMPENVAPYVPGLSKIKPLFNWLMWRWVLATYNQVDVVTAQSGASAALIRAQGLRRPVLPVSCGLDLARFYPDPTADRLAWRTRYGIAPDKKAFLFVGRVDKEKRVDVLLRAMHQLQRDDIQLVVAGQGAASNNLQALAQSLELGEKVRFTGFVPNEDLPHLLNSVDIFTMPSPAELLSIASLEAMACARPMLVADAMALPELVTNGVNGYLFTPGNVDEAARRMAQLADESARWPEMGQASLEQARRHSLENVLRRYEKIYTAILTNASLENWQPSPAVRV